MVPADTTYIINLLHEISAILSRMESQREPSWPPPEAHFVGYRICACGHNADIPHVCTQTDFTWVTTDTTDTS